MKISYNWLKDYVDLSKATPNGIPSPEEFAHRINEAGINVQKISYLKQEDGVSKEDVVIDIQVSRELSDLTSMMWTANEVCGIFKIDCDTSVKYGQSAPNDLWKREMIEETSLYVNSTTNRCKMLVGRIINRITAKESPVWVKDAVIANGYKPNHTLLDIPLYVTRNLGQPMYIFDLDKLGNKELIVEDSKEDGFLISDGVRYDYKKGDLIITSGHKTVSICGVIVDDSVKVDRNTEHVIIFTAIFDTDVVIETMTRLNVYDLNSIVASYGSNHASEMKAIENLTSMLYEFSEAKDIEKLDIYSKYDFTKSIMTTSMQQINGYLSTDYTYADIVPALVNGKISAFVKDPVIIDGTEIQIPVCEPSVYVQDYIRFGSKFGSYRNRRLPCDLAQAVICFLGCDRIKTEI